jgi:hypothetical protein
MSKNAAASVNRPAKLTVLNTLAFIYKENGIKGLYRGVTPRIGLGIWQTVCMVSFADYVKAWYAQIASLPSALTDDDPQGQGSIDSISRERDVFCAYDIDLCLFSAYHIC